MSDKLEALSQPDLYLRHVDRGTGEVLYTPCGKDYPRGKGYHSQAHVTALLAALEEMDGRRLVNLHGLKNWQERAEAAEKSLTASREVVALYDERLKEAEQRAEAAGRREEHLKADVAVMGKRIAELEQRPQRPIKLPDGFRIVPIKPTREQLAVVQVAGKSVVYTDMVLAAPEYPGFKVEGE